jgi:hypothetical protein
MYSYPLKFEFPMFSLGRQLSVTDANGHFIMRMEDPFFSFKDAMTIVDGSGKIFYNVVGDTSFRFIFQIASMSTLWNIQTADGQQVATFDHQYFRFEEFQNLYVNRPSAVDANGRPSVGGIAGQMAANMMNHELDFNLPRKLVYRIRDREEGGNALGWIIPSKGTSMFDLLPYSVRIQILKIPFVARAYSPSYDIKFGSTQNAPALKLKKQNDLFIDRYILEKVSEFSDADERWAIPSLAIAVMFERTRLKEMADW